MNADGILRLPVSLHFPAPETMAMITLTQRKLEALTWNQWLEVWKAAIVMECHVTVVWNCGNVETITNYAKLARAYDRLEQIQV